MPSTILCQEGTGIVTLHTVSQMRALRLQRLSDLSRVTYKIGRCPESEPSALVSTVQSVKARWSWSSASLPAPFICLVAADRGQLAARPCAWLGNVINKGNVTPVGEADFHDLQCQLVFFLFCVLWTCKGWSGERLKLSPLSQSCVLLSSGSPELAPQMGASVRVPPASTWGFVCSAAGDPGGCLVWAGEETGWFLQGEKQHILNQLLKTMTVAPG